MRCEPWLLVLLSALGWSCSDEHGPSPSGTPTAVALEEMCLIPAGPFIAGSEMLGEMNPLRDVDLDAFYMDRHEVTNAQYREFLSATGHAPPTNCHWGDSRWTGDGFQEGLDDHPVVCVDLWDAAAYCAWTGKRLPTGLEWEKAARGTDGRPYPWGEALPDCERANYNCDPRRFPHTVPVGTNVAGASPFGVMDMSGNVFEWTMDLLSIRWRQSVLGDPSLLVHGPAVMVGTRGGSMGDGPSVMYAPLVLGSDAISRCDIIGFRCAYSSGD